MAVVANLQPLNWQVPLVNPDRTPTSEFQRAWASLQTSTADIPALDTAAEVSAVLDKLGATPGSLLRRTASGWEVITGADGDLLKRGVSNWDVLPSPSDPTKYLAGDLTWQSVPSPNIQTLLDSISSTRGVVLYRGNAGWAALSPGTSGYFLKTNGAGADPAWAAGGGGGGGGLKGVFWPLLSNANSSSSAAFASKANIIKPNTDITVSALHGYINNSTVGAQFKAYIFEAGGTGLASLGTLVGSSSAVTVSTIGYKVVPIPLTANVTLVAGTTYYVMITLSNATSTTSVNLSNNGTNNALYNGLPFSPGLVISGNPYNTGLAQLASNTPTTGNAMTIVTVATAAYGIGIELP